MDQLDILESKMKKLSEFALSKNYVPTSKLSQSNAMMEH